MSEDWDDEEPEEPHHCATGAASADEERPPHPLDLAVQWRRYQELAIARLLRAAQEGERRLQLVAPPGSGKTLMGLFVALTLGRPIVVLANTRTIAAQWRETLLHFAIDFGGHFGGRLAERVVDELPSEDERMPLLLVTTYQAFTRQRPSALQRGEDVAERLAPAVARLHERYARAEPLLVLDECHHLTAWWAEAIGALLDAAPGTAVLGLTATPPEDASAEERRRFERLVGSVTHEIPLVGAVREGALVPFRDLAVFVRPEEAAEEAIAGADARWSAWLDAARDSVGEGADTWVPGLLHHARERTTIAPGRRERGYDDVLTFFDKEADFGIGLCRYLRREGLELPADVYPMPEMSFPPTRADLHALVDDYVVHVLTPTAEASDRPVAAASARASLDALAEALRPLGIRVGRRGLRGGEDGGELADLLAASRTRIVGMLDVLRREWRLLGDEICAAVICDFVRTASGGAGGRQDDDAEFVPGAIGAFRAIIQDEELCDLLPILATGEEKWIASQLLAALRDRLGPLAVGLHVEPLTAEQLGGAAPYVRVRLPNHEGVLLRALTGLLERDTAHAIVGTRVLLGEGWDCRALDTLVDLTSARSHVAVNQLRGRALRLHDERPEKVAHLWDVVAVPAVPSASEVGLADLRRFLAKHERFHAPSIDGSLERGAGHVHPGLRGDAQAVAGRLDVVGAELWALSEARGPARARWRLGEPVGDDELLEVRVEPPTPEATERAAPATSAPSTSEAGKPAVLPADRLTGAEHTLADRAWRERVAGRRRRRVAQASGAAMVLAGVALGASGVGVLGAAGVALVGAVFSATVWMRDRRERDALAALLRGLAPDALQTALLQVTVAAAREAGRRLREVRVEFEAPDAEGGSVRVRLRGSDAVGRARMAAALQQVLSGSPTPVYALEVGAARPTSEGEPQDAGAFEPIGLLPLPIALGTSRKMAEAFAAAWQRSIGPATLVSVRRERGSGALPYREPATTRWLQVRGGPVVQRTLLEG